MLCPYCGSQNPDDATLCSSCNATLSAAAQPPAPAAAEYAPAPPPPGPYAGEGAPTAPGPAVPAVPKKSGKAKWIALIVIGGIVLLGLSIALIAFVLTSAVNSSRVSLDTLVKAEPEKVAQYIEDLEVVKLYGNAYYTPSNMKDTVSKANKAFDEGSRNKADKLVDDIKEMRPWAIGFFKEGKTEGENGYRPYDNLKLASIQEGADPTEAVYYTYRVLEDPSAEDIYKIAREVAQIDEISIGVGPTQDGEHYYGQNVYYVGYGSGPGTTLYLRVDKLNNVYEIAVYAFNNDEVKGEAISIVDKAKKTFDDNFKSKETFPEKK